MLQIKLVEGKDSTELNNNTNEFLATIQSEAVKDITVDVPNMTAIIQYILEEKWKGHLCCDCQHWDDGGSLESVTGLCQECGGRRRFNNKSCPQFKDVRE